VRPFPANVMNKDQINNLAEKIAQVIASESKTGDLGSIQKSLDAINERLDRLEASPSISNLRSNILNSVHPSQDKFAVAEAIVEGLFAQKEKACTFEPTKACDQCSMCNSRGF